MILTELFKDYGYKLTQFTPAQIQNLENSIIIKQVRDKTTPYQLYLMVLMQDLNYPASRIAIEYEVTFGRETKRADICIFDKDRPTVPYFWWN